MTMACGLVDGGLTHRWLSAYIGCEQRSIPSCPDDFHVAVELPLS